jgi:hypothetical protein
MLLGATLGFINLAQNDIIELVSVVAVIFMLRREAKAAHLTSPLGMVERVEVLRFHQMVWRSTRGCRFRDRSGMPTAELTERACGQRSRELTVSGA